MTPLPGNETLIELHRDPVVARQIQSRMRDPCFSTGGMICHGLDLVEAMEDDAEYLWQNNIDRIQIQKRITLCTGLAIVSGQRANWKTIAPRNLHDNPAIYSDARLPQANSGPLRIPYHPHWTIIDSPVYAELGGLFRVEISAWTHVQRCPFDLIEDRLGQKCVHGFRDVRIHNIRLNKSIILSETAVHMAVNHGYFERSPVGHYSLDVATIIEVLDIKPGKSYDAIYNDVLVPIRPLLQQSTSEKDVDTANEPPFLTMKDLLVDNDEDYIPPPNPRSHPPTTHKFIRVVDIERTLEVLLN